MDDYTVVRKDGRRITMRITSTDGRAIPDLEELFRALGNGNAMVVKGERKRTESVGLFIGDLHIEPILRSVDSTKQSRRSWLPSFSLPWQKREPAVAGT